MNEPRIYNIQGVEVLVYEGKLYREIEGVKPFEYTEKKIFGKPTMHVLPPPQKKVRVCSICDKPGHDVRKCPKGVGMHPDNPRTEKGDALGRVRHCKNCGKTGHRRDTCPAEVKKAPQQRDYEDELDQDTIDRIKELQEEGYTSGEIAKELLLPLKVINKHWAKPESL